MSECLKLLKELIKLESITPNDAGCQELIAERLKNIGFNIENMKFGEVDNLWARYGTKPPLIIFAGHTDVVPTGPLDAWDSPPFKPTVKDGFLYGRGSCDMKSGLAAMIIAAENHIKANKKFNGSIGFLLTSDEEGPSIDGTQKVIKQLLDSDEKIDYCIVGEASSETQLGDQIRVGRRGSLHGKLIVHGQQGHIAYPDKALNPIHAVSPAIHELSTTTWDAGNEFFPPTTFQISNIHAGTSATNIIPGVLGLLFNFRFSTESNVLDLQFKVNQILESHNLKFDLEWDLSGSPFLSNQGDLTKAAVDSIKDLTGITPKLSTGGGTSDARFIAPTGAEVIEIGPVNNSAHEINESVKISDLETLTKIYESILAKIVIPEELEIPSTDENIAVGSQTK